MEHSVLLVEGNPGIAVAIEKALKGAKDGPFIIERVGQLSEGVERLKKERRAAVVLDLFLPDSQGISTFAAMFASAPDVPILVLSGSEDEDLAQEAVARGAYGYLTKDCLDTYSLTRALHRVIARMAAEDALLLEKERARVTLNSVADAVITIDNSGSITSFNRVAETMTGRTQQDALGRPFAKVVQIVHGQTREAVPDPVQLAIKADEAVGLGAQAILIRRDGCETSIKGSAAPIHCRRGLVAGAVMVLHGASEAQPMAVQMTHLAQHDILTDLPNRLLLNDRITQAISLARRQSKPLAVLFLDLNGFKQVNDSLGHEIGDQLLRQVAKRITAAVRTSDTVSRIGGDEFVVLLPEVADAVDAAFATEKILAVLAKPYAISGRDLNLTGCIGIGIYPEDGRDAETLLRSADAAMYRAKGKGPSSYEFFEQQSNLRDVERQFLARGLGRALERQEFLLYYQPKIDIEKGIITGAEALIRWMDPIRGLILPARFLPLAEDTGLMVPIGQWVLREACRQARAWMQAGLRPIPVAVNISSAELREGSFLEAVCRILKDTGLEPQYLELELTESVLMKDDASTISALLALKTLGVRLAVDDFGSGYSSLGYLRRFPVDTLKIDQSLLLPTSVDEEARSFLRAIISMGRILKKRVVAEGVETRQQLEFIAAERCSEAQGNFFSPPVVAEHFAQLHATAKVASRQPATVAP